MLPRVFRAAAGAGLVLGLLSMTALSARGAEAPEIHSVAPEAVEAGQIIKLTGRGFGGRELWFGGPPILIDDQYAWVVGWADDRIYIRVPEGLKPGAHAIRLRIGGMLGPAVTVEIVSKTNAIAASEGAPKIRQLQVKAGLSETLLSIEGANLGREGSIQLAGRTLVPQKWSENRVEVRVPPEIPAGEYSVGLVSVGKSASIGTIELVPLVRAMDYADGKPGDRLVLMGAHFVGDPRAVEVTIGSADAVVERASHTEIVLRVPADAVIGRQMLRVTVTTGGQVSPAVPFRVLPVEPGIVRFEKAEEAPRAGKNRWEEFGESR